MKIRPVKLRKQPPALTTMRLDRNMADSPIVNATAQIKDIPSKRCTKCEAVKPLADFGIHKKLKDGRDTKCKTCKNANSAVHYSNNRERLLAAEAARYRANPEKVRIKSKAHYEKNKDRLQKLHKDWRVANKHKVDAIRIAYAEKYRDKHNAYARDWAKNNPEKMKRVRLAHNSKRYAVVKSGLSKSDIDTWLDGQPKRCFYCGCDCDATFEVDHFYPLSKGGLHELENLRIACQPCNRRKSAKDPYKFIEEIRRKLAA